MRLSNSQSPIWAFLLGALVGCLSIAQHSYVTDVKVEPPVPVVLEPEPGDRVYIDPATGKLIFESRGMRRETVLRNLTRPKFESIVASTRTGADYTFALSKGPAARQAIHCFYTDLPLSVQIQHPQVPAHWLFLRPGELKSVGRRRVTWTWHVPDDDMQLLFRPGMQAGPFSYTANAWPGLISIQVSGYKPIPTDGSSDEALEPLIGKTSEWAREEARKVLESDANLSQVYVVGPKLRPDLDLVPQLQKEFAFAATLEEFRGYRLDLELLATYSTASGMGPKLTEMEERAKGLPRDFFSAILSTIRAARP